MNPLIGAHVSIAGGVSKAPERGAAFGCTAIQVFTKSPNQWQSKPLGNAECQAFKDEMTRHSLRAVAAHDAYLINLASPEPPLLKRSREAFLAEVERCETLDVPRLVFHPGAHKGMGEDHGIRNIVESL
ncbi:MAG: TIM barrel protein, partial [Planctomycetota bacterium]